MRSFICLTCILFVCTIVNTLAQESSATAQLPSIPESGYYRIHLRPDIAAFATDNFANVRVVGKGLKETPYLLQTEPRQTVNTEFQEYRIVSITSLKDSCTTLIFENPMANAIRNISLFIRNAAVTKEVSLEGSDDKSKWYALKDRFYIRNINNPNGTSELEIVDFPLSNYRFYRIWINDTQSAPVQILKAGYYNTRARTAHYDEVRAIVNQQDSASEKKSRITITFDTLTLVDKLEFSVSAAPPLFARSGVVLMETSRADKKGRISTSHEYLTDAVIASNSSNTVLLPETRTKRLIVVLDNLDNPPLEIKAKCYQLSRYLVAWLEAGVSYELRFGNAPVNEPVYDLTLFRDSIPGNIPALSPSPVVVNTVRAETESPSLLSNRAIIWIAIFGIILILGFMSVRMIRETTNKTTDSNQRS